MKRGTSKKATSTYSSGEPPVNLFQLQDSEEVLKTQEVASCLPTLRSLNVYGLDGLSGKMSPESCHPTEEGILVPSSGRWGNWGMGGPTESLTLNGSEHNGIRTPSRKDGDVCSLSDVLETQPVQPRFFLSAKACSGILRRAERRARRLPLVLEKALQAIASQATK